MELFIQGNVPLRHPLNEETLLMSGRRSAIKEVNDWAPIAQLLPFRHSTTSSFKNVLTHDA